MSERTTLAKRYCTLKELDEKNKLLKYGTYYNNRFHLADDELAMEFLFKFGENSSKPNASKEQKETDYVISAVMNYESALEEEIFELSFGLKEK